MKPWLSQTRWIFVPNPPRERPNAWSDGSCICAVFGPPNCGRLLGFFFAPAAARLARMTEPSIHQRSWSIWPWSSSSSSSEVTIRTQVPSARHRLKHLKTVSQGL